MCRHYSPTQVSSSESDREPEAIDDEADDPEVEEVPIADD